MSRELGGDLPKQRKVKVPVNFRPTERRLGLISRIKEELGLTTTTEALEAAIDIAAKRLKINE